MDIETIRQALRYIGAEVTERPMPAVVVDGSTCYWPNAHCVSLCRPPSEDMATYCHELAHSQQSDVSSRVAYYREDGSIDAAIWMADTLEREARAVEVIAPLMLTSRWAYVETAIDAVATTATERADWAKWLLLRHPHFEKPHRLPGKQRRAMNAAHAAVNAP
jgi:hypothetical protein